MAPAAVRALMLIRKGGWVWSKRGILGAARVSRAFLGRGKEYWAPRLKEVGKP